MRTSAYLIIDGMWGSCGKGSLAGKLALERKPDLAVCNFGPNAGHTYITREGLKVMTQQLPTAVVSKRTALVLGPGAIIDPAILANELESFKAFDPESRLFIHPRASVVVPADKEHEQGLVAIGSTRKGTASAACRKIMRVADGAGPRIARESADLRRFVVTEQHYDALIQDAKVLQIESAQGIELSLNRGYSYPTCTGRDISPENILNDVAIPMRFLEETCMVLRTFPIRVGNEYDAAGQEIGNSGPVYPDMDEITWETLSDELGIKVLERTTVTKKVRRLFRFSFHQLRHALYVAGESSLFLNYMNYLDPHARTISEANEDAQQFLDEVDTFASRENGSHVRWLGWGPAHHDVENLSNMSIGHALVTEI